MSPLPWPLMRRPLPGAPLAEDPPLSSAELPVRIAAGPSRPAPTAWEATRHVWEAGEAAVLDDLTTLTARYGPWTAAVLLFTDPKENPDV